jgi:transposase
MYAESMKIRSKRNKSGSQSIEVYEYKNKSQKHVKSFGSSKSVEELKNLKFQAETYLQSHSDQISFDFFQEEKTNSSESVIKQLSSLPSPVVSLVGPEQILGKVFDQMGFNEIPESLFKDLVISRLVFPCSKLKTVDYLAYSQQKFTTVGKIYRFLDRFYDNHKEQAESICYRWTKSRLTDITVVFYDMTTLYFESETEDDLRRIGYSKDGKFQCPQILVGLLVTQKGYPIGYDVFSGNTAESKTLIEAIKRLQSKYNFIKPIVIADSGLLTESNIESLSQDKYEYILGARLKNVSEAQKAEILKLAEGINDGECFELNGAENSLQAEQNPERYFKNKRLIVGYSAKRAYRDELNRQRGIKRLEKQFGNSKTITKADITNRGYNKLLKIISENAEIKVEIDQEKILQDKRWDGLKGYVTNSQLSTKEILENYKHLWQIEKAFRISKTDLRIRPIYHRREERIKSHLTIAFVGYAVFKEFESYLEDKKVNFSPQKAIELAKTIYEIKFDENFKIFSRLSPEQTQLLDIFSEYSRNEKTVF